jgi:hypothetical protein
VDLSEMRWLPSVAAAGIMKTISTN